MQALWLFESIPGFGPRGLHYITDMSTWHTFAVVDRNIHNSSHLVPNIDVWRWRVAAACTPSELTRH